MRSPLHVAAEQLRLAVDHALRGEDEAARRARHEADLELHTAVATGELDGLLHDACELDPVAAALLRLRLPAVWSMPERVREALVDQLGEERAWFATPPSFRPAAVFWSGAKVDWVDLAIEGLLHAAWAATRRALGENVPDEPVAQQLRHLRAEAALRGVDVGAAGRGRLRPDERWMLERCLQLHPQPAEAPQGLAAAR